MSVFSIFNLRVSVYNYTVEMLASLYAFIKNNSLRAIRKGVITMKKQLISLLAASVLAVQSLAVPMIANAEITALPYIKQTDFSDIAAAPGLPVRIDGNPWLYKGSASTTESTLQEEDGQKYVHFYSDSVKAGNVGEGSWYFYYRNQKNPITETGWAKFDIRMNEGVIQFQSGTYTDPTKGGDVSTNVEFNALTKKITATAANGKVHEIIGKMNTGEWYTALVKYDCANLEYTVTVTDKDGNEFTTEPMSFVTSAAANPLIFVFAYQRKSGAHNFDLTNLSIGKGDFDPNTVAATPTPAPTPEATTTPAPSADPSAAPQASAKPVTFKDIDNHWGKDTIIEMYQANIIDGLNADTFGPNDTITRAQFIKLVVAAMGLDITEAYSAKYTDVAATEWFAPYVQAAEKAALIDANMTADNKLLPNQKITREEMASLVVAAAKAKSVDFAGGNTDEFTDKADIAAWANDYVAGAVKLEIVSGMGDGTFAPKADATRAQGAVMISRLLKKIK